MRDSLFLCHRLPYPPNKGDKIRSHALLCHLAKRGPVHLACFVDDAADLEYLDVLEIHPADLLDDLIPVHRLHIHDKYGAVSLGLLQLDRHPFRCQMMRNIGEIV